MPAIAYITVLCATFWRQCELETDCEKFTFDKLKRTDKYL
jgi:hypothetical protein